MESKCDTCKRGDELSFAKFWCEECQEALCDTCNFYHKRMKNTSGHRVKSVHENTEKDMKCESEELCPEHGCNGEVLEYYCVSHLKLCCSSCVSQYHSKCQTVCSFDEAAETMINEESLVNITGQLSEIEAKTEILKTSRRQKIDKLNKKHRHISDTMASLITNAKARLDKFQFDFRENMSTIHNEQKEKINCRRKCIEKFQKSIREDHNFIQRMLNQGTPRNLFIATERAKCRLKSHIEELKLGLKDEKRVDYELCIDDVLNKITTTLKSSVEVKVISEPLASNGISNINSMIEKLCNIKTNHSSDDELAISSVLGFIDAPLMTTPTKVNEILLEGSRFHSVVFLPDGNILLPDYNYEKLKVFEISGRLISEYSLYRRPWDVAYNSTGELIVSFPNIMFIKKYKLNRNKFSEIRSLDVNSIGLSGFDAVLENYLIAGLEDNVIILGLDGKIVQQFPVSTKTPRIASSRKELRYYYTDGDAVICKSLDGQQISCYSDSEIKDPVAITVDINERIYVCCWSANTLFIHQISEQGQCKLVVRLDDVNEPPRNVIFDPDVNYFILIQHHGSEFKGHMQRSSDLLAIPESSMEEGIAKIYKMPKRTLETHL